MENLPSAKIQFSPDELKELNESISKITIFVDRYIPVEQNQIQN